MKQADALIALLAGGGAFMLLGNKTSSSPPVVPPIPGGGPGAPGAPAGGNAAGTVLQVAGSVAPVALKAATGAGTGAAAQTSSTPEEIAIGTATAAGAGVGFFVVIAVWIVAIIVATISAAMIMGAKWIQQKISELNTRAIPNMYECEFALLRGMLDRGGYTYEISDVPDDRFTWYDRSQSQGSAVMAPGFRKLLRNVKYQGSPVNQTSFKYLLILARLLSFEYAWWLATYGVNIWNNWGDPTGSHPMTNAADGAGFAEIWGVPLANGQPNDAIYDSAIAAFEAVRKPGLIPFSQLKIGMQAQAIMYAAKVAGGDGGLQGGPPDFTHPKTLQQIMGIDGVPGISVGYTEIIFSAAQWGGYEMRYNFKTNTFSTTAPK